MGSICSLMLFCCFSSCVGSEPAPAAQEILVAKPQLALVWQGHQPPAQVWLVRLTPNDLTYKLSASASQENVLHAGKGVLGVQLTDGDIFGFVRLPVCLPVTTPLMLLLLIRKKRIRHRIR